MYITLFYIHNDIFKTFRIILYYIVCLYYTYIHPVSSLIHNFITLINNLKVYTILETNNGIINAIISVKINSNYHITYSLIVK